MNDDSKQHTRLKNVLSEYSFDDLGKCFLALNLWIPNVASPIKIEYLYVALESFYADLCDNDNINSYADFEHCCKRLFELLPSFMMLEDYVPEPDWGEIRYYFQNHAYKIFYGGDLSNSYDFYYAYELIHEPFESAYSALLKRSPTTDMRLCLELQDFILTNLAQPSQVTTDNIEIGPGDIVIPTESFWKSICDFVDRYDPEADYSSDLLALYTKKYLQAAPFPSIESFSKNAYRGRNCPYFFIRHYNRY